MLFSCAVLQRNETLVGLLQNRLSIANRVIKLHRRCRQRQRATNNLKFDHADARRTTRSGGKRYSLRRTDESRLEACVRVPTFGKSGLLNVACFDTNSINGATQVLRRLHFLKWKRISEFITPKLLHGACHYGTGYSRWKYKYGNSPLQGKAFQR